MNPPRNDFLYELSQHLPRGTNYPEARGDGDIIITPDGRRLRIERALTVADLVKKGDAILTSYNTGGFVIGLNMHHTCCCPLDTSQTRICKPSWQGPADTRYHVQLVHWTIVFAQSDAKQDKKGRFYDSSDYGWINELVATPDGRIVHLYENNNDYVTVSQQSKVKFRPAQLTLF